MTHDQSTDVIDVKFTNSVDKYNLPGLDAEFVFELVWKQDLVCQEQMRVGQCTDLNIINQSNVSLFFPPPMSLCVPLLPHPLSQMTQM